MIKYCLDCWNKNQQSLREQLEKDASLNSCEYEYLVKLVTRYILGKEWDAENIIVVDNGDYQGTLLFLIPLTRAGEQPLILNLLSWRNEELWTFTPNI